LANKKGDKYKYEECGLVIAVEDPCGCETCEIVCCHEPMKPVKRYAKGETKTKAENQQISIQTINLSFFAFNSLAKALFNN
jgi:hypothetical protein